MRFIFTLLLVAIFLAPTAEAQPICGPHKMISENLKKKFTETPKSMGVTNSGSIVEVYLSPKGSWTLVMTQPNGMSCLIAAGQDWETLPRGIQDPLGGRNGIGL